MIIHNKRKGFSLVEIVVVIAVLAVVIAILAPALLSYVENSRMRRDDSAMDEVVNAFQLAITDAATFDEAYSYCIPNNYVTYSDSSGHYSQQLNDEEFWAPDGSGPAVTITFNPENGKYNINEGIVNDMTFGNGSVAEKRTAEGVQQCYFYEMGQSKLISSVKQTVGDSIKERSATYKNSSYTVFIRFKIVDGTRQADVYGLFNGTNLHDDCPAAVGSNTSSYDTENKPITTTPSGGRQNSKFSNTDLSGGGTITSIPSYKQPSNNDNLDDDTVVGNIIPIGGTYYVGVSSTSIGDYTGATATYTSGQLFPETVNDGDVYVYGDYEYRYNMYPNVKNSRWSINTSQNGWGVKVLDDTKNEYGEILSKINGKSVTNMYATFKDCTSLTTAPVIPNGVTNMYGTFYGCTSLITAPVIPNSVTNMRQTFYKCTSLTTAPVIPSSVTSLYYTFFDCTSLTTAPVIPSSVTDMSGTFQLCTSLKTYAGSNDADGDFSNYVISEGVTNMYQTFYECIELIIAPVIPNSVTNMYCTFSHCSNLTTAPVIPNSVTDMEGTFQLCTSLATAPEIPNSVTNMYCTFNKCSNLTTAPVIPNSVTDMTATFQLCTSLIIAPVIPNSVTNMECTFYGCTNLKSYAGSSDADGDFSNYIILNSVTNMHATFSECINLTTAPVIPNSITNMAGIFQKCTNLTGEIEINANPSNYKNCFYKCAQDEAHAITLKGASTKLNELKSTGYNNGEFITVA